CMSKANTKIVSTTPHPAGRPSRARIGPGPTSWSRQRDRKKSTSLHARNSLGKPDRAASAGGFELLRFVASPTGKSTTTGAEEIAGFAAAAAMKLAQRGILGTRHTHRNAFTLLHEGPHCNARQREDEKEQGGRQFFGDGVQKALEQSQSRHRPDQAAREEQGQRHE